MGLLNSILNHIEEALIITDKDGKVLFRNENAFNLSSSLFSHSLENGSNFLDALYQDQRDIAREMFRDVQSKRRTDRFFAEYPNSSGIVFYLAITYIPIIHKEQLTHVVTIIHDITPQKVFEQKLVSQAMNISSLIENANAIIIGVDTRGYVVDWNAHCHTLIGYSKNEIYAKKFAPLLLKEGNWPEFEKIMNKVLDGESIQSFEMPVVTADRKSIILLLSATPRKIVESGITGAIFVGQDITEITNYRQSLETMVGKRTGELQRALKKEQEVVELKSRFVSMASHEFRTPLSSIEFEISFIKNNKTIRRENLLKKLNSIEKHARYMTSLLDDVLTYGKSETGKIPLIISNVVLEEFMNGITQEIGLSTKNSHTIRIEFLQAAKEIQTDEKLLRNILINLLTNAIKFSPLEKTVFVTLSDFANHLVIRVRDAGMGIAKHEFEKIFEPFIRSQSAAEIPGTGLGLSIVKKAVELLQGSIEFVSEIGTGTTFTVMIPNRGK